MTGLYHKRSTSKAFAGYSPSFSVKNCDMGHQLARSQDSFVCNRSARAGARAAIAGALLATSLPFMAVARGEASALASAQGLITPRAAAAKSRQGRLISTVLAIHPVARNREPRSLPLRLSACFHGRGGAMGQMTPFEASSASSVRYVDESSFFALSETLSELREFYALERDPGRASWLSEIIEEFGETVSRLEPAVM